MGKLALEGIRVADFTWMLAGPTATRFLADHGAEVIKIETATKWGGHRTFGPWAGKEPSYQYGGGWFHLSNRNKMAMTLNLNTPKGVEVCKRLIKVSDVAVENFSARAMKKFGLDYSVLREVNPRLIMCSMAGYGQTGPYGNFVSFGPTLQAIGGATFITGYPGRTPTGIGCSVSDFVGGTHAAFLVLAALEYRRKTGKGQYIDLSQHEGTVSLLGVPLLDYIVNKRVQGGIGNHHPSAAPHGCYRCQGDERWCVIAVFSDEEWQSFCGVIDNPEWTKDPKFATSLNRVKNVDELDRLIEGWTVDFPPEEVMKRMQGAGIAAGVVQNTEDLMTRDPHLKARGFHESVEHPVIGRKLYDGIPVKLSETPGSTRTPAPFLGQHTDYVLKELLGMSQEEIDQLAAEGVLK